MTRILVLAKTPVPGRVKTRLCPPWTLDQAAMVAAAALDDTLETVGAGVLAVDGDHPAPAGWDRIAQRGDQLPSRLANAFTDAGAGPVVLIGMDTPQVTRALLAQAAARLADADAVLGLAEDGGWWALGLRDPAHAEILRAIPTSLSDTGARTLRALQDSGLRVSSLPVLRDVDTVADARAVADLCPADSQFRRVVTALGAEVPV
ncbi:TIGR04282 family arsenosugar biosynthesis glycosyltransferase [Actinoplanes sp. CA-051413]|uniref:TIGR04282 family arsenosugar biosynthesis glycosyltransferase n=1 Tax=Actinoplanes sp. CA-051413 TaxID=3239899 RepID=UPI003D993B56